MLLGGVRVTLVTQSELGVPEVPETGRSFIENAIIKARTAAEYTGLPALADDSGIAIDALRGAPGIYSARYAGAGSSDTDNLEKLLTDTAHLADDQRTCRFICVAVYMRHAEDPVPVVCQGVWEGQLLRQARGDNGFGYDPIFWVAAQRCSSAQMSPEMKNAISHRARAMQQMVPVLRREFTPISNQGDGPRIVP